MIRRFATPHYQQPISALATWARRIAVFALVAAILSVLVVRFGFLEYRPALITFLSALATAGAAIVVAFAGFAAIWVSGARGLGRIAAALAISLTILAYPAYLGWQYHKLPKIHDITTDPIDPPNFDVLVRLRGGDGANPAVYAGLYSAELQRRAYPDVEPMLLETTPQRAYEAAIKLVGKRKWLVVDARAPQAPAQPGHIEAVARTPLLGLREDIAIRIMPDADGSRVDMRSSSRYFDSDLGSNAARIVKFAEDLTSAVEAAEAARASKTPTLPPGPRAGQSKTDKGKAGRGESAKAKDKTARDKAQPAKR
jgi:uncharacterized protein (DUF1499 family)